MILTGRDGYLSCAAAGGAGAAAATAGTPSAARQSIKRKRFIEPSLDCPSGRRSGLDSLQTVRAILRGEEDDIGLRRRLAGVDDVGRNVEHRPRRRGDLGAAD